MTSGYWGTAAWQREDEASATSSPHPPLVRNHALYNLEPLRHQQQTRCAFWYALLNHSVRDVSNQSEICHESYDQTRQLSELEVPLTTTRSPAETRDATYPISYFYQYSTHKFV
jgi:hypothetical protein